MKKPTKAAKLLAIGYRALKQNKKETAAKVLILAMEQEDAPMTLEDLLPQDGEMELELDMEGEEESSCCPCVEEFKEEEASEEAVEEEVESSMYMEEDDAEAACEAEAESAPQEVTLSKTQAAKIRSIANRISASGHPAVARKIFASLDKVTK